MTRSPQRSPGVPMSVPAAGSGTERAGGVGTAPATPPEVQRLADALAGRVPSAYERFLKPVSDRVLAAALLVLASPLLVVIAVAVLCAVGRPVLIGQQRAGRAGEPFTMLKFRTMRPDRRRQRYDRRRRQRRSRARWRVGRRSDRRDADRRVTHKTRKDPRHTRTGLLLRKLSLDELPQLYNVLVGDMSLVGPRPELYHLTDAYAPWQRARHLVKPGITGLWQTTRRGEGLLLSECIDLDLRYIAELSAGNDLAILLRTPMVLLRNKGVV